MDVYAFRIVVKDFDACYRVLGQMHHLYQPKIKYFEDYIALPKPNSYQALHTTLITQHGVNIEIQIRTEDMDTIAKYGIAAHWSYKESKGNSNLIAQLETRNWFQGLVDTEDNTTNSLVMLENIKQELGNFEIHTLTPQGRIVILPAQATAVDFAYAVHTDLGHACIGVKVDGEYSFLNNRLESGQTVKILTSKKSHPNADWLNFVATHKARNSIRLFLKQQPKEISVPEGRRLLKQALNTTNLTEIPQTNIDCLLDDLNLQTFDDLLHEIGSGRKLSLVVARLLRGNTRELTESDTKQQSRQSAIKGTENMMTSYASCCKPVAGDKIVAHITPGKGVVVHCDNCHNVEGFKDEPDKYISLEWDMDFSNQYEYSTDLTITMVNHKAGLAKLFNVISKSNANVIDIQTSELPDHVYLINLVRVER
jgi:RelA/SpoT family (p)ppGpp synthetase